MRKDGKKSSSKRQLQFSDIVEGSTKRERVKTFVELVGLMQKGIIELSQNNGPYTDITIAIVDGHLSIVNPE